MWSGLGRGESKWLPLLKKKKKQKAKTSFLTSLFSQQFTDYADSTADMLRFQLAFLKNILG